MFRNPSPLARLALFMICLSVAGAFVAGVHFFAVDLSQQNAVSTTANEYDTDHMYECQTAWSSCMNSCGRVSPPGNRECESRCNDVLGICVNG